jgi:hypothetical protein
MANPHLKELDKVSTLNGNPVRVFFFHDEGPTELHWFKLPKMMEKHHYRTIGSYEAFRNREANRFVKYLENGKPKPTFRASCDSFAITDFEFKHGLYKNLKAFYHADLWDFYKAVGYDYKKQRYIRT